MANILRLLPDSVFKELENEAVVAVVLSLQRNKKIVTGATADSVEAKIKFASNDSIADIAVIGGAGLPFIISGKPANTKFPVRAGSGGFRLVPELESWKAAVGFAGPDFLLARSIAKNPRAPVDIATPAQEIFIKRTEGILPEALAKLIASEIKEDFDENKNKK